MPNIEWDGASPEPSASVGENTLADMLCKLDRDVLTLRGQIADLASVLAQELPKLREAMGDLQGVIESETRRGIEKSDAVLRRLEEIGG